ncbi:MAG: DUF2807 domain-containing protein [Pseudomonadota bacterium]|nr:DUF2807 domain-containing protein [Pseudomonadota bacterium]
MKQTLPLVALAAIATLAGGCNFSSNAEARDAGPAVDRTYQVGAFDRMTVSGPYEVTVKTGGQPGVVAHGGEAVLAETEIVVEDGELRIVPKGKKNRWNWGKGSKVRIEVSAAALRGATIAGSGTVSIDRIAGGDFEGEVAGSGDLGIAQMDAGKVAMAITGSGNVRAAGKARALDVNIAGSGDVDLSALEVVAADVSIAGSGNVRARATGAADVSIMGSGDVEIKGGAKCSVSKQGSGDVRCS